jgi:uncharacterized membrane protein (DUF485 family)
LLPSTNYLCRYSYTLIYIYIFLTMAWLSFLKSKDFDPAEFEKQLTALARKITSTERKVQRLNRQRIRFKHIVIVYGSIGYLGLALAIAAQAQFTISKLVANQIVVLFGSPLGLVILWRLYAMFTVSQINKNTRNLETLREEHALKIEELKEKTKYGATAALLNRFSEGTDAQAVVDEEIERKQALLQELEKVAQQHQQEQLATERESRGWLDTFVDVLSGSGTSGGDILSPDKRYALICRVCHNHNGLAPPGVLPGAVRYLCPRCQQPNGEPGGLLEPAEAAATIPVLTPEEQPKTSTETSTETPATVTAAEALQ